MGHTPPCCAIVRMRAGLPGEMQFSPDTATLTLAVVGIVPGMSMDSVLADIDGELSAAFSGDNRVSASARQVPGSFFVAATEPAAA